MSSILFYPIQLKLKNVGIYLCNSGDSIPGQVSFVMAMVESREASRSKTACIFLLNLLVLSCWLEQDAVWYLTKQADDGLHACALRHSQRKA